jgi:hypothetical protein
MPQSPGQKTKTAVTQRTESELPTSFGPKTGTPEEGIDDTFVLYAGHAAARTSWPGGSPDTTSRPGQRAEDTTPL